MGLSHRWFFMSLPEVYNELERMIVFGSAGQSDISVKRICIKPHVCYVLFNPITHLEWNGDGLPSKITISGMDQNGVNRTFERDLTWTQEGYIQDIGKWREV